MKPENWPGGHEQQARKYMDQFSAQALQKSPEGLKWSLQRKHKLNKEIFEVIFYVLSEYSCAEGK